jgi:hypothetical protein
MDVAAIIPNAVITMAKSAIVVCLFITITIEKPIYKSFPFVLRCLLFRIKHISNGYICVLIFAIYCSKIKLCSIIEEYSLLIEMMLYYPDTTKKRTNYSVPNIFLEAFGILRIIEQVVPRHAFAIL